MKLYPQQIRLYHQDKKGFCKKSGSKVQESDGNFTLGTDGLLHYTETHHDIFHHNLNKTGSQEFCIEATEDQGNSFMGIENCPGVACCVICTRNLESLGQQVLTKLGN